MAEKLKGDFADVPKMGPQSLHGTHLSATRWASDVQHSAVYICIEKAYEIAKKY